MPFNPNTFPNAENIRPPNTEERRVVEPSTRAAVILKKFQELQYMWKDYNSKLNDRSYAEKAYLREEYALKLSGRESTVDISV
jgi:hypothetical protein